MRNGSRLHRLWLGSQCMSLCVKLTFFHPNDVDQTEREFELEIPKRVWRPYCWVCGNHRGDKRARSEYYGECVYCGRPLPKGTP